MANHKSALKRIRSNNAKRIQNKYHAKTMRNALKSYRALTDSAQIKEAQPKLEAMIDKLAKKSVIHKNKAANLKSQIATKANAA